MEWCQREMGKNSIEEWKTLECIMSFFFFNIYIISRLYIVSVTCSDVQPWVFTQVICPLIVSYVVSTLPIFSFLSFAQLSFPTALFIFIRADNTHPQCCL